MKAIVLGSTSGIGRETAIMLAEAGAEVIVHGRRDAAAQDVVHECRKHGVRAEAILADLGNRTERDALVDRAWSLFGRIDAWLHLAGADTLTGPGAHLGFEEKLELLWKVDVESTIRLCRAVGQRMIEEGIAGRIVTMGWDQAETGMEGASGELFATTKGAVMAFTRSLALSLAPQVNVNCVAPGWIKTAWGDQASTPWQERVIHETPLRRWGLPADVASACRFLVGPEAAFLTGQILRVNGGAIR